jgi:hypothetical protein
MIAVTERDNPETGPSPFNYYFRNWPPTKRFEATGSLSLFLSDIFATSVFVLKQHFFT